MADWIEWTGGRCPLKPGQIAEVIYRDRNRSVRHMDMHVQALWDHVPQQSNADIIAYRIVEPGDDHGE